MADKDPQLSAPEGIRVELNQAADSIDEPLATLTLAYTGAGPVLTATGGNSIPTPIRVVDDAGHTIALYTAGPASQSQTRMDGMTRWQMR